MKYEKNNKAKIFLLFFSEVSPHNLEIQDALFKLIYNSSQFHETLLQSVAAILYETSDRCQAVLLLHRLMADFILLVSKSTIRWKENKLNDPISEKSYCIDRITLKENQIIEQNVFYWDSGIQS